MKLWLKAGIVSIVAALGVALPAHAGTQDFVVDSFTADYTLAADAQKVSQLKVREQIVAEFPAINQNHGILRAIPQSYKDHSLELQVTKVADAAGKSIHYTTSTSNDNLVLKIGDADRYVHGKQTYVIDYSMRGVTQSLNDHDELYWDVNGDQWPQAMGRVAATVHIDPSLHSARNQELACYTGEFGSLMSNCSISGIATNDQNTVVAGTNGALQGRQTLSIVLSFKKGTFADYSPSVRQLAAWAWLAAQIVVPPLLAGTLLFVFWRRTGRDAKGRGVIAPQYLPPKEVSVLAASAVLKEKFESKAISATIIDLAVRHFIKIYDNGRKSYEVELVKAPKGLRVEEVAVVRMLFGGALPKDLRLGELKNDMLAGSADPAVGTRVSLNDLKNKLAIRSQVLGKSVNRDVAKAGYFVMAPDKAKTPYVTVGGLLLLIGFVFFSAIGMGLVLAGLVLLIGARVMPARTARGVELRDYLYGLCDYMKLAEADRLNMLQSPTGRLTERIDVGDKKQLIKLYEHLLPYAMLFGIEKQWAKQFADLYDEQPDWYSGSSTFNAAWFASSLGGFGGSVAAVFAPPSSSGGSGFGGGAGGGGGGGGGGGW